MGKIKNFFNKFKRKVFKYNVTRDELLKSIRQLQEMKNKCEPATEEYESLQNEISKEFEIYKKWKDSKKVSGEVKATLVVVGAISFFALCLDQESPKALKLAQFVCKIFKLG